MKNLKLIFFTLMLTVMLSDVVYATGINDELISAVKKGDIQRVKELVSKGVDLNAKDKDDRTPLMSVVSAGFLEFDQAEGYKPTGSSLGSGKFKPYKNQTDIVRYLIESGAQINATSSDGTTPLLLAVDKGYVEIVKLLVSKGADVNMTIKGDALEPGDTPLTRAAAVGEIEIVQELLIKGAKVNEKRGDGSTALFIASYLGYVDIVKILLQKNAEVNVTLSDGPGKGQSPLIAAAATGHLEIVKALLDKGANPNAKDAKGNTALSFTKRPDIVNILKAAGAK